MAMPADNSQVKDFTSEEAFFLSAKNQFQDEFLESSVTFFKNSQVEIEKSESGVFFDLIWATLESRSAGCLEIVNALEKNQSLALHRASPMFKSALFLFRAGILTLQTPTTTREDVFFDAATSVLRTEKAIKLKNLATIYSSNRLTRDLLLKTLLETYFFVKSAPTHIALAVAHAESFSLQCELSEYLADEAPHANLLKKGLLAAGFDESTFEKTKPSWATCELIEVMKDLAKTKSYGLVLALNEAMPRQKGVELSREAWSNIEKRNLVPSDVLAPFKTHEAVDEEEEHAKLGAAFFNTQNYLAPREQDVIMDSMRRLLDAQENFYKQFQEDCKSE